MTSKEAIHLVADCETPEEACRVVSALHDAACKFRVSVIAVVIEGRDRTPSTCRNINPSAAGSLAALSPTDSAWHAAHKHMTHTCMYYWCVHTACATIKHQQCRMQ